MVLCIGDSIGGQEGNGGGLGGLEIVLAVGKVVDDGPTGDTLECKDVAAVDETERAYHLCSSVMRDTIANFSTSAIGKKMMGMCRMSVGIFR